MRAVIALLLLLAVGLIDTHGSDFVVATNVRLRESEGDIEYPFFDPVNYELTAAFSPTCPLPDPSRPDCLYDSVGFRQVFGDPQIPLPVLRVVDVSTDAMDWYVVEEGDLFNSTTIDSGVFEPLQLGSTIDVGQHGEFYLGVLGFRGFFLPLHGWAQMRVSPNGVEMINNAVFYGDEAYGAGDLGVIVGSTVPIPEPSTSMLIGSGFALLVVIRNQLKRRLQRNTSMLNTRSHATKHDTPESPSTRLILHRHLRAQCSSRRQELMQ